MVNPEWVLVPYLGPHFAIIFWYPDGLVWRARCYAYALFSWELGGIKGI